MILDRPEPSKVNCGYRFESGAVNRRPARCTLRPLRKDRNSLETAAACGESADCFEGPPRCVWRFGVACATDTLIR